jgi:hypothetical protein
LQADAFPDNATHAKLFNHAKEGWKLLKETHSLLKKHPKESMDQAFVDGKWKMLWWSFE